MSASMSSSRVMVSLLSLCRMSPYEGGREGGREGEREKI